MAKYDPDKVDWVATHARSDCPKPLIGAPPFVVLLNGDIVSTTDEAPPLSTEVAAHLEKRRPGRPAGSTNAQRAAVATPKGPLPVALPARGEDDADEETEKSPGETMPSKPRPQTLPGTTGSAAVIVREIPYEVIHEAIEQNIYADSGVELRIHYKNARGVPTALGTAHVPIDNLVNDFESWLREQFGGGTFRIDARDPVTKRRALPIPVFEVSIHGPMRLHPNGTIVAPGQTAFPQQGTPPMSGFQGPWGQPLVPPVMPGNFSGVQMAATQQSPWAQATPAYGSQVHQVPVMSMPPDAIAMSELQKAQSALDRERRERARDITELTKRLETVTATLNDQRLKEEDRARQIDAQQMRDELRRVQENFRAQLDQERNKRPAFDLNAFAAIVASIVPIFTAMISTRGEQTSKSLELQTSGVNNLIKATLERTDSKWLEKLISVMPVLLPAIGPLFKAWAEQKSPAAQADLVATLSENHLTALSMMARLMNEMVPAGPEQPAWVPVFQQMVGTVVASIDSMVKSNKSSVGLPVTSRHLPQPQQYVQQPVQQQPAMTPAQAAMGQSPAQTYPQPSAPMSIGWHIAQMVANEAVVPADLKTPAFLKLIEDLHNQVDVEQVAMYFANHMRELEDHVPQMLQSIWTTDDPEALFQSLFSNLPIWQQNQAYTLAFIHRAAEILMTPAEEPAVMAPPPSAPSQGMQFFSPAVAAPVA